MDTLHRLVATFLLGTLCVGALPACDNEKEESETLVTKLRVLAVRADPAEMTTKESVTFDALVVGAQGEVSYSWSFCPLAGPSQLGFPCFSDEIDEEQRAFIPDTLLPCLVGEAGSEPTFTVTPCPLEFYAFDDKDKEKSEEDAMAFDVEIDPEEGIEMFVRLVVTDESGRRVEAVKVFSVTASETPNENPTISAVVIQEEPEADPDDGVAWESDESLVVDVDDNPVLQVSVEDAAAELVALGSGEEVPEELLFSWYVTSGRLQRARTALDLMDNEFTPDSEGATEEQTLWVVVRDDRGGIGWIERAFVISGAN